MKQKLIVTTLIAASLFLIGCSSAEEPAPAVPTIAPVAEVIPTATAIPEVIEPTLAPVVVVSEADSDSEVEENTEAEDEFPVTSTPVPEIAEPEPIIELSPAELLVTSFSDPIQTNGEALVLFGQVLDVNGVPVPQAVVEIWQTDDVGVYDHPDDSGTGRRDTTFQFYGTAVADPDGWYGFRTILPGEYEPRPRHIHFKVKQNGSTLLTSQFYFTDDIAEAEGETMFTAFKAIDDSDDLLLLQLVQGENSLLANGRIVIDTGVGSGELPVTPSQQEGPFYPVVNVADFDNDLTILP